MRGMWLVLWLVGVACYAPSAPSGVPCVPASPSCPNGQACIGVGGVYSCVTEGSVATLDASADSTDLADAAEPGDASGVDGPPASVDTDLDGLLDPDDNCPATANANQYNEDGDRFGDVCDPCPPVADDHPLDTDSDGIADACDPRPALSGDVIARFEGFSGGIPTTGWFTRGTWTAAGGTATGDSLVGAGHLSVLGPTTQHETVSTSLTLTSVRPSTDASIGVIDSYNHVDRRGMFCHLTTWGATSRPLIINEMQSANRGTTPFEMTVGQTYSIQLRRDTSTFGCRGERGTTTATATESVTIAPREIGLRIVNVTATFAWLMVVNNP